MLFYQRVRYFAQMDRLEHQQIPSRERENRSPTEREVGRIIDSKVPAGSQEVRING